MRTAAVQLLPLAVALVGTAITAGNGVILAKWFARRKHGSLIPALGGLLLAAAVLLVPTTGARHYAGLPLIVDPGCLYLLACGVVFACKSRRRARETGTRPGC